MKFDMHCHTREGSIDASIRIADYTRILKEKGFDGMLTTDHDSYKGYEFWNKFRKCMPEDFIVLKGIEYDTRDAGHFIVILPDNVRLSLLKYRGMSVEALIELVHEYGGVIGPAHPYGMRSSSAMYYNKIKKNPEILRECDFLEGMNSCEKIVANTRARELASRYDLMCIGGSDSHKAKYVGTAFTIFDRDITCNDDLVECIKDKGVIAFGGREREYQKIHEKRNWMATTLGFKAFNFSLGKIYAPYRNSRLKKALYQK